jgi:hypothetical protein
VNTFRGASGIWRLSDSGIVNTDSGIVNTDFADSELLLFEIRRWRFVNHYWTISFFLQEEIDASYTNPYAQNQ